MLLVHNLTTFRVLFFLIVWNILLSPHRENLYLFSSSNQSNFSFHNQHKKFESNRRQWVDGVVLLHGCNSKRQGSLLVHFASLFGLDLYFVMTTFVCFKTYFIESTLFVCLRKECLFLVTCVEWPTCPIPCYKLFFLG